MVSLLSLLPPVLKDFFFVLFVFFVVYKSV
jgi:hypothetical protein